MAWHPFRGSPRRRDADFAEEIAAHLALEAERLTAEGHPRAEAALEARRRFGNVTQVQERFHDARGLRWLEELPGQFRRAARSLRRAPLFSIAVIVTLGLGIGATTAVFGLVDAILLRPLPFPHPGALVDLSHTLTVQGISRVDQSDATYLYYRGANRTFTDVGAYREVSVNLGFPSGNAPAERVPGARVSAGTFGLLGVAPLAGRAFRDEEDRDVGAPVVIVGEALWRRDFAADPRLVGRQLVVDGVSREVVGIMPAVFHFPGEATELWLPIGIDPSHTASATFDYRAVARLRPGVTAPAAAADLQRLLPLVPEAYPGRLTADAIRAIRMRTVVRPLRDVIVGEVGPALWIVLGAAVFLLLTACANVANLILVRAEDRQHDLAVRRALGAGRGAIARESLAESALLAAAGGALGLIFGAAGLGLLRSWGPGVELPRVGGATLDGAVIVVAGGVTLLVTLVLTLVPILRQEDAAATVLAQTGRSTTGGRSRHRARRSFVMAQVALALLLLAGAGVMTRSFARLRAVPLGFDADAAYTFRFTLSEADYPTTGDATALVGRVTEALGALPGVRAVGALSKLPLVADARRDTAVWIEDRPLAMNAVPNLHQVVYATPGAFAALGIPLVEGHTFGPPDATRAPLEVVVSRALAHRYWGDSSALGRRLRLSAPTGPWFTIIGVTGDVRGTRADEPPDEAVYLPLVTAPGPAAADGGAGPVRWLPRELAVVVRGSGDPALLGVPVRRAMRALAPGAPVYEAQPMRQIVARSMARTAFTLLLLRIASLAALLLGAVGLYGVVSYMVRLRLKEMAVRLALGAEPDALRRMILAQAAAVTAAGIAIGLGAAFGLMHLLGSLLFNVAPTDPLALTAAAGLMAVVALAASWLPARRAAATDPAAALRTDA